MIFQKKSPIINPFAPKTARIVLVVNLETGESRIENSAGLPVLAVMDIFLRVCVALTAQLAQVSSMLVGQDGMPTTPDKPKCAACGSEMQAHGSTFKCSNCNESSSVS